MAWYRCALPWYPLIYVKRRPFFAMHFATHVIFSRSSGGSGHLSVCNCDEE
jgi:hypothetical protein